MGRRGVLGPEYEAAADRLDTANYLLSDLRSVHDWLENWVDGARRHVTLQQVNEKTLEILRAKAWFRLFMEPIILGAVMSAHSPAPPPGRVKPEAPENTAGKAAQRAPEKLSERPPETPSEKAPETPRVTAAPVEPLSEAQATARGMVEQLVKAGKKVVVNIGGTGARHEPQDAINVNNQAVGRKHIPNHVQADGSDIGKLFDSNSVDRIDGHNMAPGVVDWARAAPGAYKVLKPGSVLQYAYRGANADAKFAVEQLRQAGFTHAVAIEDTLVIGKK